MKRDLKKEFLENLIEEGKIRPKDCPAPYNTSVYAEYQSNTFYDEANNNYPLTFLRSDEFFEQMEKHPKYMSLLPDGFFDHNELWTLLKGNPISALTFRANELTPSMYAFAVMQDYRLFPFLNINHQTTDLVLYVINKEPLMLEYVRNDLLLYYICNKAVKMNWRAIEFVPSSIIDKNMIDIANSQEDADLLYILPDKHLNSDIYTKAVLRNTQKAVNYLAEHLFDEHQIPNFLSSLERLDHENPERFVSNLPDLIISMERKQAAFVKLIEARPHWIELFKPCHVSDGMFGAAVSQGVYPKLNAHTWTPEKVSLAFNVDPKALVNVPNEQIRFLGSDRLRMVFEIALGNGWVNELPHYFFIADIIEEPSYKNALIEHRLPFSYMLNHSNDIDWDKLTTFRSSIDELRMTDEKAPSDKVDQLIEHGIEHYVVLADTDKTLSRTIEFLKAYPRLFNEIPEHIKKDRSAMATLIKEIPRLASNFEVDELVKIFS